MTALRDQEWEYFRGYISKGVALSVSEQLPPEESELDYLATKRLGGEE
jgi:hypothetical protein